MRKITKAYILDLIQEAEEILAEIRDALNGKYKPKDSAELDG